MERDTHQHTGISNRRPAEDEARGRREHPPEDGRHPDPAHDGRARDAAQNERDPAEGPRDRLDSPQTSESGESRNDRARTARRRRGPRV